MEREFNINSIVKIKLTLQGKLALYNIRTYYGSFEVDYSYLLKKIDNDGYIKLKMWEFIKYCFYI